MFNKVPISTIELPVGRFKMFTDISLFEKGNLEGRCHFIVIDPVHHPPPAEYIDREGAAVAEWLSS